MKVGPLEVDPLARQVRARRRAGAACPRRSSRCCARSPSTRRACSRARNCCAGCGAFGCSVPTRTLDSHASRLRRKLADAGAPGMIVNVWGVGYRLIDGAVAGVTAAAGRGLAGRPRGGAVVVLAVRRAAADATSGVPRRARAARAAHRRAARPSTSACATMASPPTSCGRSGRARAGRARARGSRRARDAACAGDGRDRGRRAPGWCADSVEAWRPAAVARGVTLEFSGETRASRSWVIRAAGPGDGESDRQRDRARRLAGARHGRRRRRRESAVAVTDDGPGLPAADRRAGARASRRRDARGQRSLAVGDRAPDGRPAGVSGLAIVAADRRGPWWERSRAVGHRGRAAVPRARRPRPTPLTGARRLPAPRSSSSFPRRGPALTASARHAHRADGTARRSASADASRPSALDGAAGRMSELAAPHLAIASASGAFACFGGAEGGCVGEMTVVGLHCGRGWVTLAALDGTRVAGLLPPSHPGLSVPSPDATP